MILRIYKVQHYILECETLTSSLVKERGPVCRSVDVRHAQKARAASVQAPPAQ